MRTKFATYLRESERDRPGFDRKGENSAECRTGAIIVPEGSEVKPLLS